MWACVFVFLSPEVQDKGGKFNISIKVMIYAPCLKEGEDGGREQRRWRREEKK